MNYLHGESWKRHSHVFAFDEDFTAERSHHALRLIEIDESIRLLRRGFRTSKPEEMEIVTWFENDSMMSNEQFLMNEIPRILRVV